MALKIKYNSPVILTFALISIAVFFINYIIWGDLKTGTPGLMQEYFVLSGTWNWGDPFNYFRLFSYSLGHADLGHIAGNMSLFLLIAPIMEEKYGSQNIAKMMIITILVTAVFQIILFDTGLVGASGLVFMFVVLVSFANVEKGTIPLTFILVAIFYVGQEVLRSMDNDNTSQYAHIVGGIMGGVFGFMFEDSTDIEKK
ncbi:MAG: rhomboid family intramembrane serine protease [Saprospiraceae bacterium]|nr:rhomboid family intramembrane serine protease [Saprospiraceae bacterium]